MNREIYCLLFNRYTRQQSIIALKGSDEGHPGWTIPVKSRHFHKIAIILPKLVKDARKFQKIFDVACILRIFRRGM